MTINYQELANANIAALQYSNGYKERLSVLTKIAHEFNDANLEWAIACSCALFFDGIIDNFHDLDLLIAPSSWQKAYEILSTLGTDTCVAHHPLFDDVEYTQFEIDGIDIDIICEFGFNTFDSHWQYHFKSEDLLYKYVGELKIPYIPSEIQYVFYAMMVGWQPQRIFKRDLIAGYLKNNMRRPSLLKEVVKTGELPPMIAASIYELLFNV